MAAPTDVSAGDLIQAAHINDLIDYVESGHTHDGTCGSATIAATSFTGTATVSGVFTHTCDVVMSAAAMRWTSGVAVVGTEYSIQRNLDCPSNMQLNVPTGAGFEFSVNDVQALGVNGSGVLTVTNNVRATDGSAGTPEYSFSADTDTGMYRTTCNTIGFGAGNGLRASINTTTLDLQGATTLTGVGSACNQWTSDLLLLGNGGEVKLGANNVRSCTEATNAVSLFNGTVPIGTLTNGVTLYSKDVTCSAELHVMDEAGNETLLSPHNPETNEWWFVSKAPCGRVLRVHMERLVKKLEETFGWGFVEEFIEGCHDGSGSG